MRGHAHRHSGTHHRHGGRKAAPLFMLHAPQLGEDVELFSNRTEDSVEYESIIKDFSRLHDAEIAADNNYS